MISILNLNLYSVKVQKLCVINCLEITGTVEKNGSSLNFKKYFTKCRCFVKNKAKRYYVMTTDLISSHYTPNLSYICGEALNQGVIGAADSFFQDTADKSNVFPALVHLLQFFCCRRRKSYVLFQLFSIYFQMFLTF